MACFKEQGKASVAGVQAVRVVGKEGRKEVEGPDGWTFPAVERSLDFESQ